MKYPIIFLSLLFILVLSACSDGSTKEEKGSESMEMGEEKKMEPIGREQEDYVKEPAESGPVNSNSAAPLLPLKPGFYVMGTDCEHPANAGWRYWSGQGLSGASTVSCKMILVEHQGREYTISQTCTNTYDKSMSASELKLLIADDTKFTLSEGGKSQVFKYCEQTPAWINY